MKILKGMPADRHFSGLLTDLDGTLIHSRPGIENSFAYAFAEMGLDPAQIDLSRYLGPPLRWSFGQHFSDEADIERAVEIYRDRYARLGMHECSLFPGVRQLLERLRAAGVRLATATSKPREVVLPILEEQDILICREPQTAACPPPRCCTDMAAARNWRHGTRYILLRTVPRWQTLFCSPSEFDWRLQTHYEP